MVLVYDYEKRHDLIQYLLEVSLALGRPRGRRISRRVKDIDQSQVQVLVELSCTIVSFHFFLPLSFSRICGGLGSLCSLCQELAEETDIQVVQGMVSPELLEHIALSMGVTLRVQDTYIEVLGRKDATQSASAELEKLLQKAGFCEKTLEAETHSIQSQSTIPSPQPPSPQGPKIAEMGQNLQNIHGQTQPVENRCPTCHCGRFCGTCGAQIWQTIPVFNMAPMPAVSTMNTMNTLGMAVTGYGMGTEMSGLSKEDDSPAAQTPDPAEECGHPTMMFPMFQMAQAPYVLVPAESGQRTLQTWCCFSPRNISWYSKYIYIYTEV